MVAPLVQPVLVPKSEAYPCPTINLDRVTLVRCVTRCRAAGVTYGLGAKATSGSEQPGPGGFRHIDCSGFVGWALSQATGGRLPDLLDRGSVEQHDWIDAHGFKPSSVVAAIGHDNIVRVAFLPPALGGGIGHVMLVLDGLTLESHGGSRKAPLYNGPDRRAWDMAAHPFMGTCMVYALTRPEAE